MTPYTVDKSLKNIYGEPRALSWFGDTLLKSLKNPALDDVVFTVERKKNAKTIVIVNCIDFLYGHSLLKLFNVESYLKNEKKKGIIVIIPKSLRWMVPTGVSEIWTVSIPFSKANNFYPELDKKIKHELRRFDSVYIAGTSSHPKEFAIQPFTNTDVHDFASSQFRITFIWREDRLWTRNNTLSKLAARFPVLQQLFLRRQHSHVRTLFTQLRDHLSDATFTVAGYGQSTVFPAWIEDKRQRVFTEAVERELCNVYSQSRIVIGIHGSNMLLPSAHAGITIDLMPSDRWGNLAQDIVFQKHDIYTTVFRYRFLPQTISIPDLTNIVSSCVKNFASYLRLFDASVSSDSTLDKK